MELGKIYFCSTPIGNLGDMTYRAVEILNSVDKIYCEDTRHSRILLDHYNIDKPLVSYHKFNEQSRAQEILDQLREGQSLAVISDAGMPGISDPGEILIRKLQEEEIDYEVLPGANAAITAVAISALEEGRFLYWGFLPSKAGRREQVLESLVDIKLPIVFYEAPHRLIRTLESIYSVLGNRQIGILRELTKKFEEHLFLTVEEALNHQDELTLKGEMVLIVYPEEEELEEINIKAEIKKYVDRGMKPSQAAKTVAKKYDLPKNQVYKESLGLDE